MNRTSYGVVRQLALDAFNGVEAAQADNVLVGRVQRAVSKRLEVIWDSNWWPELMVTEERWYRPLFEEGGYAAGSEVYWRGTSDESARYAVALGTVTTETPDDGSVWGELSTDTSASWWETGTEYEVGDRVQVGTGVVYWCRVAHTSGTWATDLAAGKWGALPVFIRNIELEQAEQTVIGKVKAVWTCDPRVNGSARRVKFEEDESGIIVREALDSVWVEFRRRCPQLTGSEWSATATYAAGAQMFFTEADGTVDFWESLTATAAGESPITAPAKWARVEIPKRFEAYLAAAAVADLLRADGQMDKARAEEAAAEAVKVRTVLRWRGQQPGDTIMK